MILENISEAEAIARLEAQGVGIPAPRPDLTFRRLRDRTQRPFSGRSGAISGILRALGSLLKGDRRSPRVTGRAKRDRAVDDGRSHQGVTGRPVVLASREAGDQGAEELVRHALPPAVLGGPWERFRGRPRGWQGAPPPRRPVGP